MELTLFWTEFATDELEKIYQYYKKRVSISVAKKLVLDIYNETNDLIKQPLKGQTEELLKGRNKEFRYLVCKNYKIIYWINEVKQQIEIFDVFDTRQSPTKIIRSK
jgi:toxin ParE1/3/4